MSSENDLCINISLQTFEGNEDRNSEVKHVLYEVLTRYLRFLAKAQQGRVCMRTEVFGVKIKPGDECLKHNEDVLHILLQGFHKRQSSEHIDQL